MKLWRISNHVDLSGAGGMRFSARWHDKGRRIVYTATFQLLTIDIDEIVAMERIEVERLPSKWMTDARHTRRLGDQWLARGNSLLLRVPSAIVPDAFNVLINPRHPDSARMRIEKIQKVPLDLRLA
jgi:RES domain-containing protein